MKRLYILIIVLLGLSCSDGDLQIETLDFDSVAIQNCGTLNINTEIFFKINNTEALILELQSGLLKNEVTTETIVSSISGESQLTFRAFNDNVTSNYFCDDFPPISPIVIEEIEASSGNVLITTTTLDSVTFTHTIQLEDIILINSLGESIIDLTINDFGTIDTTN